MVGCNRLPPNLLRSSFLINLDNLQEESITIACASGEMFAYSIPVQCMFLSLDDIHPSDSASTNAHGIKCASHSDTTNEPSDSSHVSLLSSSCSTACVCSFSSSACNYQFFSLSLTKGLSGHSGMDIHKGRAHAGLLLIRALMAYFDEQTGLDISTTTNNPNTSDFTSEINKLSHSSTQKSSLSLISFHSVEKINAIPGDASCIFCIKKEESEEITPKITKEMEAIMAEYRAIEPNLEWELKEVDISYIISNADRAKDVDVNNNSACLTCLTPLSSQKALSILSLLPHGCIKNSFVFTDIPSLSTNLYYIHLNSMFVDANNNNSDKQICNSTEHSTITSSLPSFDISFFTRTMSKDISSAFTRYMSTTASLFSLIPRTVDNNSSYSSWNTSTSSRLFQCCREAYTSVYGRDPPITAVHAGMLTVLSFFILLVLLALFRPFSFRL